MPAISIDVVNGKMRSRKIELVMNRFINKEIDVLVCTSIIETGIDIANANTVIINNAQQFGLSQLYQIRGRVGRGIKQAYAYLLLSQGRVLKKDAHRRLKVIEENTHLGAGYNISNMDLEIRGAGAVFGYKQSGQVSKVGVEYYNTLLKEAVNKKLDRPTTREGLGVLFYGKSLIPRHYISNDTVRLSFYTKINKAETTIPPA